MLWIWVHMRVVKCCLNECDMLHKRKCAVSVCLIYKGAGKDIFLWNLWAQRIVHTFSNVITCAIDLKADNDV